MLNEEPIRTQSEYSTDLEAAIRNLNEKQASFSSTVRNILSEYLFDKQSFDITSFAMLLDFLAKNHKTLLRNILTDTSVEENFLKQIRNCLDESILKLSDKSSDNNKQITTVVDYIKKKIEDARDKVANEFKDRSSFTRRNTLNKLNLTQKKIDSLLPLKGSISKSMQNFAKMNAMLIQFTEIIPNTVSELQKTKSGWKKVKWFFTTDIKNLFWFKPFKKITKRFFQINKMANVFLGPIKKFSEKFRFKNISKALFNAAFPWVGPILKGYKAIKKAFGFIGKTIKKYLSPLVDIVKFTVKTTKTIVKTIFSKRTLKFILNTIKFIFSNRMFAYFFGFMIGRIIFGFEKVFGKKDNIIIDDETKSSILKNIAELSIFKDNELIQKILGSTEGILNGIVDVYEKYFDENSSNENTKQITDLKGTVSSFDVASKNAENKTVTILSPVFNFINKWFFEKDANGHSLMHNWFFDALGDVFCIFKRIYLPIKTSIKGFFGKDYDDEINISNFIIKGKLVLNEIAEFLKETFEATTMNIGAGIGSGLGIVVGSIIGGPFGGLLGSLIGGSIGALIGKGIYNATASIAFEDTNEEKAATQIKLINQLYAPNKQKNKSSNIKSHGTLFTKREHAISVAQEQLHSTYKNNGSDIDLDNFEAKKQYLIERLWEERRDLTDSSKGPGKSANLKTHIPISDFNEINIKNINDYELKNSKNPITSNFYFFRHMRALILTDLLHQYNANMISEKTFIDKFNDLSDHKSKLYTEEYFDLLKSYYVNQSRWLGDTNLEKTEQTKGTWIFETPDNYDNDSDENDYSNIFGELHSLNYENELYQKDMLSPFIKKQKKSNERHKKIFNKTNLLRSNLNNLSNDEKTEIVNEFLNYANYLSFQSYDNENTFETELDKLYNEFINNIQDAYKLPDTELTEIDDKQSSESNQQKQPIIERIQGVFSEMKQSMGRIVEEAKIEEAKMQEQAITFEQYKKEKAAKWEEFNKLKLKVEEKKKENLSLEDKIRLQRALVAFLHMPTAENLTILNAALDQKPITEEDTGSVSGTVQ